MKINPFRGFLYILSARVGGLVVTLLVTPILVRILGGSAYGRYAFVTSLIAVSTLLVNAGLDDGVRKFVAEDRSVPSWGDHVLGFYTRLGAVLAGVGAAVIVALNLLGITASVLGEAFEPLFYILACILVAEQTFSIARSALMGKGLENLTEPLLVGRQIVFAVVGLSLAYFGFGVSGVLFGDLAATVLVTGIVLYSASSRFDFSRIVRKTPEGFPKRQLLSFNSYTVVFMLLGSSLYNVDVLLLQPLAGSQAAGYYKAALKIVEFLWFVPKALEQMLLHSTSELWSKDKTQDIRDLSARVTRYTLVLSLPFALGLLALARPFIRLYYGAEFTAAVTPLLILLPGTLFFAITRPVMSVGQGRGDIRPLIWATGSAAVLNLLLNLTLIPRYGMTGAAVATSVGYGSMLLFYGFTAHRVGYGPFGELRLARVVLTTLLTAPVILGTAHLIDDGVLSLLVVPPVGFLTYSWLALRTKVITPEEVIVFVRKLPLPKKERIIYALDEM